MIHLVTIDLRILRAKQAMNETNQRTLLDELDSRQNEVISELDKLNQRVEQLLTECTPPPVDLEATECDSPAQVA